MVERGEYRPSRMVADPERLDGEALEAWGRRDQGSGRALADDRLTTREP
jgi:hypothetical protein